MSNNIQSKTDKKKIKRIKVTDLEFLENNLDRGPATLASYIDKRAGFKTKLLCREYDPTSMVQNFYVMAYE